jgi:hypothetical protein
MSHQFERVPYTKLNSRQRENYNFQKVSAVLADFGFSTIRLSSDWQGADFIAQHLDGTTFLKVQLKTRLTLERKYMGRGLHVCFPSGHDWYLFPHDEFMRAVLDESTVGRSVSWERGGYSYPTLSKKMKQRLSPYRLPGSSTEGIAVDADARDGANAIRAAGKRSQRSGG